MNAKRYEYIIFCIVYIYAVLLLQMSDPIDYDALKTPDSTAKNVVSGMIAGTHIARLWGRSGWSDCRTSIRHGQGQITVGSKGRHHRGNFYEHHQA